MKKYRYIMGGCITPDTPVKNCNLLCRRYIRGESGLNFEVVRICVDTIPLHKYQCDCYSTTDSDATLGDLEYMPMVLVNGKWCEMPELVSLPSHQWYEHMIAKGYTTAFGVGYKT